MKRVAIIGGGLAGTACAYVLRQCGLEPVIYEVGPDIAPGASGNAIGLYNPRLSAERTATSNYYASAFAFAARSFAVFDDIDWAQCGSLHLLTDPVREKRFLSAAEKWRWDRDHIRIVDAEEASQIAGVELKYRALYLPDAGFVSPKKLCEFYADGNDVQFNTKIESLEDVEADAVILACGMGVKDFHETKDLPVNAVRGQITQVSATAKTKPLKTNLCYGGYFSPALNGAHTIGATFQRWLDHNQVIEEDNGDNIRKLSEIAPELAEELEVAGERASVRCASKDHFPIVGQVAENLYVSTAHGSHGIISSLAAAHLLADIILDKPHSLPKDTIEKLQPGRFLV